MSKGKEDAEKKRRLLNVVAEIKAQNALSQKEGEKTEEEILAENGITIIPDENIDPIYSLSELEQVAEKLLDRECCINCDEWNPVLCRAGDCPAGIYEPVEIEPDGSDDQN